MSAAAQKELLDSLYQIQNLRGQRVEAFFYEWYINRGSPYYFVFRKNLAITNIQHAELLALIEAHAQRDNRRTTGLQFASQVDFVHSLANLMEDFFDGRADYAERCATFARLYAPLLANVIVVQPLYGSCAIYLPPNLDIDLMKVVGESGYIHFAGRCVYISAAQYASEADLLKSLSSHLNRFCHNDKASIPFLVYSHEDWDDDDSRRHDQSRFRNGVHDLKIFLDRAYIGNARLASLLGKLRKDASLKERLWFIKPGQLEAKKHLLDKKPHSLILLRDYGVETDLRRSETVYYILYDQLLHNQSPCHLFEENKPGWSGPVTAPHTLFGAMINLARPFLASGNMSICDPFVGSGTTACEVAKLPGISFTGSDKSSISEYLVGDNLLFFGLNAEQLTDWENRIREIEDLGLKLERPTGDSSLRLISTDNTWVADFVRSRDGDHLEIDEARLAELFHQKETKERLDHYMQLRFVLRNEGALLRGTTDIGEKKKREIGELVTQIQGLKILRERKPLAKLSYLQKIPWHMSPAVVVDPKAFQRLKYKFYCRSVEDMPENSFDVIVTDPPYGYNTQEQLDSLAELYATMISKMIRSLKSDGHLIMCLPERSYTGRKTFSFTHKDLVVRQVIMAAKEAGYEVVTTAVPTPVGLYRAPYYWRSEKALSRSIVHFRLRRRDAAKTEKRVRRHRKARPNWKRRRGQKSVQIDQLRER